jgi:hypothetical protein
MSASPEETAVDLGVRLVSRLDRAISETVSGVPYTEANAAMIMASLSYIVGIALHMLVPRDQWDEALERLNKEAVQSGEAAGGKRQ